MVLINMHILLALRLNIWLQPRQLQFHLFSIDLQPFEKRLDSSPNDQSKQEASHNGFGDIGVDKDADACSQDYRGEEEHGDCIVYFYGMVFHRVFGVESEQESGNAWD